MTVLYAEDDLEDFDLFSDIVYKINPSVSPINVRNGAEALEFLENSTILPDFVFLDINMPSMDGKSCLKYIKNDERFAHIPVVIYTTSNSTMDIELCYQLGAEDYVQKPNTFQDGTTKLSKFFKIK